MNAETERMNAETNVKRVDNEINVSNENLILTRDRLHEDIRQFNQNQRRLDNEFAKTHDEKVRVNNENIRQFNLAFEEECNEFSAQFMQRKKEFLDTFNENVRQFDLSYEQSEIIRQFTARMAEAEFNFDVESTLKELAQKEDIAKANNWTSQFGSALSVIGRIIGLCVVGGLAML